MSEAIQGLEQRLRGELSRVLVGVEDAVCALTVALVARGHVLVQGVPGLGKTLLAKSLARVLRGEFKRIQGTPDLMPSDITGVHIFDEARRQFVFRPGPLFADVVLVDEVNRAGPKTQSALLEAMEERQVSVEREVFALPEDFLVLATQNPREFEGTYPLPESQLDRFMLRIDMDYPQRELEAEVLNRYGARIAAASGAMVAHRGGEHSRIGCTHRLRARSGARLARASAHLSRALDARRTGTHQRSADRSRTARCRFRLTR